MQRRTFMSLSLGALTLPCSEALAQGGSRPAPQPVLDQLARIANTMRSSRYDHDTRVDERAGRYASIRQVYAGSPSNLRAGPQNRRIRPLEPH